MGLGIGITILALVMWALGFGLLNGFVAAGPRAPVALRLAHLRHEDVHLERAA